MSDIQKYTTRYLGSKLKLLEWIWKESEPYLKEHNVNSIIDAFAGTGVVAYLFKQKGYEVHANDFLLFNYYMYKGIIENNSVQLSEEEIHNLINPPSSNLTFIQDEYTNVFFPPEDTKYLDDLFEAINNLDCEYKKGIAFSSAAQAILKKAPYGRFTTTKMTNIGRKTMQEYFTTIINEFNNLVLDNGQDNKAYMLDSSDMISQVNAGAVYFDPPYGGKSFSKYEHFYNFVEVYVNYWESEPKVGKLKQVKKKESVFSYGKKHNEAFNELLGKSVHIPLWIFSYNNNGGLTLEELKTIISKFKENVDIKEVEYEYANKVSKYNEYLIFAYD